MIATSLIRWRRRPLVTAISWALPAILLLSGCISTPNSNNSQTPGFNGSNGVTGYGSSSNNANNSTPSKKPTAPDWVGQARPEFKPIVD